MITQADLLEVLDYDCEAGRFFWKSFQNGRATRGKEAGYLANTGYRSIKVAGKQYLAHRLAWLAVFGAFPSEHIDHIDGDKLNNRIDNLREASRSENGQNRKAYQSNNKSEALGVYRSGRKWKAQITVHGRQMHIGTFETKSAASGAYLAKKRELHPYSTI